MSDSKRLFDAHIGLILLRIATGVLILFHGIHKLKHGHEFIREVLTNKGFPEFLWIGVPIAEVIAPILLIFGVFTRFSSLLIAIVMLFSMYLAFGEESFALTEYGGLRAELNVYFVFVSVAMFFTGPGSYVLYKPKNEWLR